MAETVYGFERGEFVEGFRPSGWRAMTPPRPPPGCFDSSPGTGTGTTIEAAVVLDPDLLAALSLVSLACERRARAALDALPARTRADALGRFRRARLSFGGRTE